MTSCKHAGGNSSGEFCYILIGVKTDWVAHFTLMNKASAWARQALAMASEVLSTGLKGIHSDTGGEFISGPVGTWRRKQGVEFIRGRPAHKSDRRNLFRLAMPKRPGRDIASPGCCSASQRQTPGFVFYVA